VHHHPGPGKALLEFDGSAAVVGVEMGQQDHLQIQLCSGQGRQYRPGLAGIDDQGPGLALVLLALVRPVITKGLQERKIEAKDIIIALDVSYSMRARDIAPTRYDFAKKTIEAFLKLNPKDNIMLIAFTSNPLLLSPPTTDHALIMMALESLNPNNIMTKGTSLKKLFAKISTLKRSENNLILITDGGEEQHINALAQQLKDTQTNLTVLALGTAHGSTIYKEDGTLLEDNEAHLVVSRINPKLETLAAEANGAYLLPAASAENTAEALYNSIQKQSKTVQQISKKQYHYTELYQWPLLLATLLFMMLHTRSIRFLFIAASLMGIQIQAGVLDHYRVTKAYEAYKNIDMNSSKSYLERVETVSLQSQFALGNIAYKQGSYEEALKLYSTLHSTSAKIKQKIYYNMANCYTRLYNYTKARSFYVKVLQLGEDADAKANLSLIAILENRYNAQLGMAHPKSQNSETSKNESKEEDKGDKETRNEDQPSSGSGSEGEAQKKKQSPKEKKRLRMDNHTKPQPLSSKVYELINKGYIHEQKPW